MEFRVYNGNETLLEDGFQVFTHPVMSELIPYYEKNLEKIAKEVESRDVFRTNLGDIKQIQNINFKGVNNILANLKYNKGKRYEDFVEGSDNVAEYGMAALITGVVAKKTGILAMLGIALAKGFKFIIAGVLWLSWKFKNFFTGRKEKEVNLQSSKDKKSPPKK